ncbi:UBC-like protein [Atractiella rhizophila]|nr:UBC-like protein [Atractiella rhizophila]
MASLSTRRLTKELNELQSSAPEGIRLLTSETLAEWTVEVKVLGETVYRGETFALKFKFSPQYPIDSPQVTFLTTPPYKPPVHPHVYTNGHICASILGTGWSPVLNTISICLSLQSMLASCTKQELPPDNDRYVRYAPENPKETRFVYHDDTV